MWDYILPSADGFIAASPIPQRIERFSAIIGERYTNNGTFLARWWQLLCDLTEALND